MTVYIVNFIVNMLIGKILLFPINKNEIKNYNKRKKVYLIITTIQLATLSGLRSSKMTWDTGAYEIFFNLIPNNISEALNSNIYFEKGFIIFCSLIKIVGGNFQTMLLVSSYFIIGSLCIFIYRHSSNPLFSIFIIICLPFYYSSFDILRHFMAISFVLLGYKYVENNNFFKYLIFIILGSLFQKIALVFLPLYFFKKIKLNLFTLILLLSLTIFSYFSIETIALKIGDILGKGGYSSSEWIGTFGGGIKTTIMYFIVFMICFLAYSNIKIKEKKINLSLAYILISFLCSIIFLNARIMIRIIMTMVAFLSISIPNLLEKKQVKNKRYNLTYTLCLVTICLVYHGFMLITSWQNVVPYIPYWK